MRSSPGPLAPGRCICYIIPDFRCISGSHELVKPALTHGRHNVFGACADAAGPARGHRLEARVEAHALGAVHAMSPNSERFQPPKLWKAIGTGIGTLMPTMPIWMRFENSRAASPSRVKIATPLPYS